MLAIMCAISALMHGCAKRVWLTQREIKEYKKSNYEKDNIIILVCGGGAGCVCAGGAEAGGDLSS